jgi:imidazolonepropionase-like amidohydrolase
MTQYFAQKRRQVAALHTRPVGAIFLILSLLAASAGEQAQRTKVVTGATLIDGTNRAPIKDAVVVITGTRISQVGSGNKISTPPDAQIIDARGKFIVPGLADMHNHLGDGTFSLSEGPSDFKKNLGYLLAWGFTVVFDQGIPDLNDFTELKTAAASDTSHYPHFFGVGVRFAAKGGHGSALGAYTPDTTTEARAEVRRLKAANVDAVKLVYDDLSYVTTQLRPMLKPVVMAAIIDEAHQQGLKAYVHAPILKHAKEVLRAGADGLVHGIISDPVDEEFIALMKQNDAIYITTHAIFEAAADIAGWARREAAFDQRGLVPKEVLALGMSPENVKQWEARLDKISYAKARLPVLRSNLKKIFDAGILVVPGSDTSSAGSGTGVVLGLASQLELALMVEAGLKPDEAIRAATINAARMIGREKDLGSVEPGKLADLVILDENPLSDIRNIRNIYRVVKGGIVHDPSEILHQH